MGSCALCVPSEEANRSIARRKPCFASDDIVSVSLSLSLSLSGKRSWVTPCSLTLVRLVLGSSVSHLVEGVEVHPLIAGMVLEEHFKHRWFWTVRPSIEVLNNYPAP